MLGILASPAHTLPIGVVIDGIPLQATVTENRMAAKTNVIGLDGTVEEHATHYKGVVDGFLNSGLRVTHANGHWRGVVVFNDMLYRIDQVAGETGSPTFLETLPVEGDATQQLCQTPHPFDSSIQSASVQSFSSVFPTVSAASSSDCPDPIDGVCLMPELELAYDLSYQAISSPGETVLDRATRELNELELFFERSFNYRLSNVTMTFLDASQDALFTADNSALDLLDSLRLARNRGDLTYVQSPRSIFHFVTGRNFPPVNSPVDSNPANDVNVVGIAYLDVFCDTFGLNTGLTDAGDAFFVSLVMAHEIGHNLGAEHDDPAANGCSSNTHVMTPSIGGGAGSITEFSSCSTAAIQATMTGALASSVSSQCLDFPIDSRIEAHSSNPITVPYEQSFSSRYQVIKDGGSAGVTGLVVEGVITDPSQGQFDAVMVTSGGCSVFADRFTCQINNAAASETLTVESTVSNGASLFEYQQTVGVISGDGIEMLPSNDTLVTQYSDFGELVLGSPDSSIDNSVGGSTSSSSDASSSSSGGGGASSLVSLGLLLWGGLFRRYVARHK